MSTFLCGESAFHHVPKNAGSTLRTWIVEYLIQELSAAEGKPAPSSALGRRWARFRFKVENLFRQRGKETPEFADYLSGSFFRTFVKHSVRPEAVLEIVKNVPIEIRYFDGFFWPQDKAQRACIKRDPVQRFKSCYSNKYGRPAFSEMKDVDQFLDDFPRLVLEKLHDRETNYNHRPNDWGRLALARHFAPQTYMLGESRGYFTHVFDIKETGTRVKEYFEDVVFERKIGDLQRNRTAEKIELTPQQEQRVADLYSCDYEAGWC